MILQKTKYSPEEYIEKVYTVNPLHLDDTYLVYSCGDKQVILTREFTLEYTKASDRIEVLRSGSSIHIYNYDTGELVSVFGKVDPEYHSRILKKCPHNTRVKPYMAGIRLVIGDRVYNVKDKMDAWISFPDKFKLTPIFRDDGIFTGYDIVKNDITLIEGKRFIIEEYNGHLVVKDKLEHGKLHLDNGDEISIITENLLKVTNRGLFVCYMSLGTGLVTIKKKGMSRHKIPIKVINNISTLMYDRSNKNYYLFFKNGRELIKVHPGNVSKYFYS